MKRNLNDNFLYLCLFISCHNGLFYLSVIFAYFSTKNVDLAGCLHIQALFNLTIFILEIPSGYLSDRFSRCRVLILGAVIELAGVIGMYFSQTFIPLLISNTIFAVGASLISGTASALLYDSLVEIKKESTYAAKEGRVRAWSAYSTGISGLVGGFLYSINTEFPILLTCFVTFLGVISAFFLVEPSIRRPRPRVSALKHMMGFIHFSVVGHREVPWIIAYSAVVVGGTFIGFWLAQPYWEAAALPYWMFGLLFFAMQLGRGLCHDNAARFVRLLGMRKIFFLMWLLLPAGLVAQSLTNSIYFVWLSLIPALIFGIAHVLVITLINERVEGHMRATVLSVDSMVWRLMFIVCVPILTVIERELDLPSLFNFLAITWLLLGIFPITMLIRRGVI